MLAKVDAATFIDLALCCPSKKAMLAVGDFGIGKTQIVRQIGEKLGLKVIEFDCTHLNDSGDILGLPSIINGKTIFNPTYWYEPDTPVLLFFDEVFRANADVRAALMKLCLDQTIADKKLAPGSRVFAAANPPGFHGYEGEIPDPAQLSRYAAYWLDPTFQEWYKHAQSINVHPAILQYLKKNQSDLDAFSSSKGMDVEQEMDGQELEVLPSRRSWTDYSDFLYNAEKIKNVKKLSREMVINIGSGLVGYTIAIKFEPFYQSSSSAIGAEDILRDWSSVKPKNGEKFEVSTASKLAEDIKIFIEGYKGKIPEKWRKNFASFIMEGLSDESRVSIINGLIFQSQINNEDWIFQITTDELQTYFENVIGNSVVA